MPFVVYRSSAGSGKTFTLVKEYLKLLLKDPHQFRHILAITFTNKAANEMKERVIRALTAFSVWENSAATKSDRILFKQLVEETGLNENEIVNRSNISLGLILHRYSEFAIGTIDSFSHRVIRTFAHDFRLPVHFDVETDSDVLISAAVEMVLQRAGEDQELTRLLVGFLETRLEEEQGWDIAGVFAKFARNLIHEQGLENIDGLRNISVAQFQVIADELRRNINEFERQVVSEAKAASQLISDCGISVGAFYYGESGIARYFNDLGRRRMKIEPNSYVRKTIQEDKWTSGKASREEIEKINEIRGVLTKHFTNIMERWKSDGAVYRLRILMSGTIYPLAVLNEIGQALRQFKEQHNLVHISEFNSRIASVVMNEPVPFIYERMGEKYHNLLIDEFQDTSMLQWMNFVPLFENSLASGHFNMVVGDGKQAIYRWRGGDIDQFILLPRLNGSNHNQLLKYREEVLAAHYQAESLNTNFRSRTEIVTFNNEFFKFLSESVLSESLHAVYNDLAQQSNPANTGGMVRIEFIDQYRPAQADADPMTERIHQILSDCAEHGYEWRDIAILTRSNLKASRIAAFLLGKGINIVSAESLLIRNSKAVRLIMAILAHLFRMRNDIVEEEIRHYSRLLGIDPVKTGMIINSEDTALMPVYNLCETLILQLGLDHKPDAYILSFLDVVLKYSVRSSHNPVDFLDYWDENQFEFSISVPEELDAVRVMTIHKAKGLQFPVVIYPYADEKRSNANPWLWAEVEPDVVPGLRKVIVKTGKAMENTAVEGIYREEQEKSMLDMLNLLYVAMTRPEDRLYVLTVPPPAKSETLDSLPKLFHFFLSEKGEFHEDQAMYHFGSEPLQKQRANLTKPTATLIDKFHIHEWASRIRIRNRSRTDGYHLGKKSAFGDVFHAVMALITTEHDVPEAISRSVKAGLISIDETGGLESLIREIIEHPLLKGCFEAGADIRNEPEILTTKGSFYRPDKVIIRQNSVIVIDYKTGGRLPEHVVQIEGYAGLLHEMGYHDVQSLLVYTHPIVEVIHVNTNKFK